MNIRDLLVDIIFNLALEVYTDYIMKESLEQKISYIKILKALQRMLQAYYYITKN